MHEASDHEKIDPEFLLRAYACGIFPMADDGEIHWYAPDPRAIIPLDGFITTRSLRAVVKQKRFQCFINRDFQAVLQACADRPDGTWISDDIIEAYTHLYHMGFAYSVEAWQDDRLAGGLYGVSIGGAFFGESMFHHVTDASKVALVHLIQLMNHKRMSLLDIQFMTDHLKRFGAMDIPRDDYMKRLEHAIVQPVSFIDAPTSDPADSQ